MRRILYTGLLLAAVGSMLFCPTARGESGFLANGPLPPVPVPPDNPQTDAKIRLGMQLYFDTRLSADNTISCAKCHDPNTGWVNHGATDTGIKGQVGGRNSGTIIDAAYMRYQFWDGRAATLEEQALGPIHNPIEMGETLENVVRKLNAIPGYRRQFQEVFGTDASTDGIAKAIAAFERTIISGPSPYDRYMAGELAAMSPAAVRGMNLFNGKGHCSACHSGADVLRPILPQPGRGDGQTESRPGSHRRHQECGGPGALQDTRTAKHCPDLSLSARRFSEDAHGCRSSLRPGRGSQLESRSRRSSSGADGARGGRSRGLHGSSDRNVPDHERAGLPSRRR